MAHKWENITDQMGVNTYTTKDGVNITTFFKDREKCRDVSLFFIDSRGIYPASNKQAVHAKYECGRRYAYLLKRPSGDLGRLLDEAEYRLSTPLCLPANNFSGVTDMMLERKVKAPEWEDVTSQCRAELVKSGSSSGHYVRLMHKGTMVALLGMYSGLKLKMGQGTNCRYKVELAKGATVSFHVFLKNSRR